MNTKANRARPLIRRLSPAHVRGKVTILPLANLPAVMAARRRSPLDDGNLNRAFPGQPGGTPTERLAHFLEHGSFPATMWCSTSTPGAPRWRICPPP